MQRLIRDAVQALAAALPDGWSKAWLRVEVYADGSGGTAAAYVVLERAPKEALAVSLPPSDLVRWQRLWVVMRETSEPWTSATLTLDSTGRFDLRHDYAPLGDEPPMARHARWARATLSELGVRAPPLPVDGD